MGYQWYPWVTRKTLLWKSQWGTGMGMTLMKPKWSAPSPAPCRILPFAHRGLGWDRSSSIADDVCWGSLLRFWGCRVTWLFIPKVICAANQNGSQTECELGNPFKRDSEVSLYLVLCFWEYCLHILITKIVSRLRSILYWAQLASPWTPQRLILTFSLKRELVSLCWVLSFLIRSITLYVKWDFCSFNSIHCISSKTLCLSFPYFTGLVNRRTWALWRPGPE